MRKLTGSGFYETPHVDYTPPKPKKPKKRKPPKPLIHKGNKYGSARKQ